MATTAKPCTGIAIINTRVSMNWVNLNMLLILHKLQSEILLEGSFCQIFWSLR